MACFWKTLTIMLEISVIFWFGGNLWRGGMLFGVERRFSSVIVSAVVFSLPFTAWQLSVQYWINCCYHSGWYTDLTSNTVGTWKLTLNSGREKQFWFIALYIDIYNFILFNFDLYAYCRKTEVFKVCPESVH